MGINIQIINKLVCQKYKIYCERHFRALSLISFLTSGRQSEGAVFV